jgi:hypothetical protein
MSARRFKTFLDLLETAATAKPGAGKFIGSLGDGSVNPYIPGSPEQSMLRTLRNEAVLTSPFEGGRTFRESLQDYARGRAGDPIAMDAAADKSSVANELLRAAVGVVAESPEEMRLAKQVSLRARAIPVFNSQPEQVRDALVRMSGKGQLRPKDILIARDITRSPEDIREIALTLIADGMPAEEALRTARLL